MASYDKKLKRGKNGISRYVGKNRKGNSEKFYLGFDLKAAKAIAKEPPVLPPTYIGKTNAGFATNSAYVFAAPSLLRP